MLDFGEKTIMACRHRLNTPNGVFKPAHRGNRPFLNIPL